MGVKVSVNGSFLLVRNLAESDFALKAQRKAVKLLKLDSLIRAVDET